MVQEDTKAGAAFEEEEEPQGSLDLPQGSLDLPQGSPRGSLGTQGSSVWGGSLKEERESLREEKGSIGNTTVSEHTSHFEEISLGDYLLFF